MNETKLTKLTDLVKVGERETTILGEFKRHRGVEPTTTPTLRVHHHGHPTDVCWVTIWNENRETATFRISPADLDYLHGQGALVEQVRQ